MTKNERFITYFGLLFVVFSLVFPNYTNAGLVRSDLPDFIICDSGDGQDRYMYMLSDDNSGNVVYGSVPPSGSTLYRGYWDSVTLDLVSAPAGSSDCAVDLDLITRKYDWTFGAGSSTSTSATIDLDGIYLISGFSLFLAWLWFVVWAFRKRK